MNPRKFLIYLFFYVGCSSATEFSVLLNHGECLMFKLTGDDGHYRSFNINVSQFPPGPKNYRDMKLKPRYIESVEIQSNDETEFLLVSTDSGLYNIFHSLEDGLVIQPVASLPNANPKKYDLRNMRSFYFTSEL